MEQMVVFGGSVILCGILVMIKNICRGMIYF